MRKSSAFFLLFGFFFILLQGLSDPAYPSDKSIKGVIIIGNRRLPFNSLGVNELKDIYQRKKTMWANGQKISFALLDSGKTHELFIRHYVQKTPAQYHRYWKKLVFSGRGIPPASFRNENSLMAHVSLTAGAIGYVSPETKLSGGVKRIKIVEDSVATSEQNEKSAPSPIQENAQTPTSDNANEKKSQSFFNRLFD
ncbi:MAG: hypothetical protein C0403_07030 [Desulfobacterium sp.]|nr:hypothetical protein [Desulfobacterium sp.]